MKINEIISALPWYNRSRKSILTLLARRIFVLQELKEHGIPLDELTIQNTKILIDTVEKWITAKAMSSRNPNITKVINQLETLKSYLP